MYDYLIVGTGLFGAVFAYEASQNNKRCLVIDKKSNMGGYLYCEDIEGITTHKYGAHIFHTNDKNIWEYVNRFAEFNRFINSPIVNYNNELYNLPANMNTFYKLWGVTTPEAARMIIEEQRSGVTQPENFEQYAISIVGVDIYEKLIKGYTEKIWGKKCTELPTSLINILPLRFNFDNDYYGDRYQGVPIGGYTQIIAKLLEHCDVKLDSDFFNDAARYRYIADRIVFTGKIDEFYGYCFGPLEYKSFCFETEVLDTPNYQGNAIVNYTSADVPFTRIIEHKHFEFGDQEKTVITREYPTGWMRGCEPCFPVVDEKNVSIYGKYLTLARQEKNVIFGGRLGTYRRFDMCQTISNAIKYANSFRNR